MGKKFNRIVFRCIFYHRVRVGQIFKFVKLILLLKMYLGGSPLPSSKAVLSLLIHLGKWSQYNSNGFNKLKNSTYLDITNFITVWMTYWKNYSGDIALALDWELVF